MSILPMTAKDELIKNYADILSFDTINKELPINMSLYEVIVNCICKTYFRNKSEVIGSNGEYFKFYSDSLHLKNTLGYYGQAWIDEKQKILLIVSSGTKFENHNTENTYTSKLNWAISFVKDVINDIQICCNTVPFQYEKGIVRFCEYVFHNNDLNGYTLVSAGHSLGAFLSQIYHHKFDKFNLGFKKIISLALECPGAKPFLSNHSQDSISFNDNKLSITINNEPNWFNTFHKQIDNVIYRLKLHKQNLDKKNTLNDRASYEFHKHDKANFAIAEKFEHIEGANWPSGLLRDEILYEINKYINIPDIVKSSSLIECCIDITNGCLDFVHERVINFLGNSIWN